VRRALRIIALLCAVAAPGALGFEAEETRDYPGQDPVRATLRIVGTTDLDLMEPLIGAFQTAHPALSITYVQASSAELYQAVAAGEPRFDLSISSAMDLQTKLVNDGLAQVYASPATDRLPDWAKWRSQVFAFTEESAVIVYAEDAFPEGPPLTRADLARALRADPDRFLGRIATYDPKVSGVGYLFATQDAHRSETFWSLAELFGLMRAHLSCCSSEMIDGVASGRFLIAYNALSPYAMRRLREGAPIIVVAPEDYTHVMLRTALIPKAAENPRDAGAFIDFLLSPPGRDLLDKEAELPPLDANSPPGVDQKRPITIGPGLLVYLDRLKRERFLEAWTAAVVER